MKRHPDTTSLHRHFQKLATASRLQSIAFYKSRQPGVLLSPDIAEQYKQLGDLYSTACLLKEAEEAFQTASRYENGQLIRGVSILWKAKLQQANDDYQLKKATIKIQSMFRAWRDRKYIEVIKKEKGDEGGLAPYEVAMRRRVLPMCPSCGVCSFFFCFCFV